MAVVLVVEDDEQVRVLAESVLQEAGHTVIAATGVDGAQALLDTQESIDVLFIDLALGGDLEAGLRVAQEARVRATETFRDLHVGRGRQCRHEGAVH